MNFKNRALSLFRPPFKYDDGIIMDSNGKEVANNFDDDTVSRAREWGIDDFGDMEKMQEAIGEHIAAALTEYWLKHEHSK